MRKRLRITPVLMFALILMLLSSCTPVGIASQDPTPPSPSLDITIQDTATPAPSTGIAPIPSNTPSLPDNTPTVERLVATEPGQPIYYYAPLRIDVGQHEAEYLVDEYPELPLRHIYVLKPGHNLFIHLDLYDYVDRPEAIYTDVKINYSNSLSDANIGVIEVIFTETYADHTESIFCGQAMFVADDPKGINLGEAKNILTDRIINGCAFTLFCSPGEIPDTLYAVHAKNEERKITAFGHPLGVMAPEEADTETYMWPDTEPSTTPPEFVYLWSNDFETYWPEARSTYVTSTYRSTD